MTISLTIIESEIKIADGIPRDVEIVADQPCSIFYTFDESIPTIESNIYFEPLKIPTNLNSVVLKLYATNNLDESEIITREYKTVTLPNRSKRPTVLGNSEKIIGTLPPYGGGGQHISTVTYGFSTVNKVDTPEIPNVIDGYGDKGQPLKNLDAPGTQFEFSNAPFGEGIGKIPHRTVIRNIPKRKDKTSVNIFDPKAPVIVLDNTEPLPPGYVHTSRSDFTILDPDSIMAQKYMFRPAYQGNSPTASFIKAYWNPIKKTMSYYHYDRISNKWLINIESWDKLVPVNENLNERMLPPSKIFTWKSFNYSNF